MSVNFQSILGTSDVTADSIITNNVIADNASIKVLDVGELTISNGATDGYVLTSDPMGVASWQENTPTLIGDVTGLSNANVVDFVGGQPASDINWAVNRVKMASSQLQFVNFDTLVTRSYDGSFVGNTIEAFVFKVMNPYSTAFGTWGPEAITFQCPNIPTLQNQNYILPGALGNSGDVLSMANGTGTLQWSSTTLNGDVTGPLSSNTVALVGGKSASAVAAAVTKVQNAATSATPNTLVLRDANGDFEGFQISAYAFRGQVLGTDSTGGSVVIRSGGLYCMNFPVSGETEINYNTIIKNGKYLQFNNTTNSYSITFKPPTALNTNCTYTFPLNNGAAGTILSTDQFGVLSWKNTNFNLTGMVTSVGNATTVVTNANLTGMVTSVGNATTVVTNANLTGECTSVGNATTLTNSAVIGKVLTGFVAGSGTVTSSDSILTAIQKLSGSTVTLAGDCSGAAGSNTVTKLRGNTIQIPVATDTLVCKATTDTLSNKTLSAAVVTGGLSCNGLNFTLTQYGGTLGSSSLVICNQPGTNGAMIQQLNNIYDVCDLGLYSLASQTGLVRMEKRSANVVSSLNTGGEIQIKPNTLTSTTALAIGDSRSNFSASLGVGGALTIYGYTAPTSQGTLIGWNRSGSSGRTTFGNQQGSGVGGFEWVNFDNWNVVTGTDPSMSLDSTGTLTVASGIKLPTVGGTSSLLKYYEEALYNTSFNGPAPTVVNQEFMITRLGNIVTFTKTSNTSMMTCNAATYWTSTVSIPARFRPYDTTYFAIQAFNNSFVNGTLRVQTGGQINIYPGVVGAGYTVGNTIQICGLSVSWCVPP